MKTAPLLSIGMIFKNEARCLERCLQSLEPLRQAISCELIMADTGSDDGSREIAERYADEVFDYEWVDDFSAARNAVMDRCCGKWYLSIDCDEWLDADISELVAFLRSRKREDHAFVTVRNYGSEELEKSEDFNDFRALRLLRLSTGERFRGAIHESWPRQGTAERLTHTILHHDGYLFTDPEASKRKIRRNMQLLRRQLEQDPQNLRTINQCIESGGGDADQMQYIRQGVELVQKKAPRWEAYGACVLRHGVQAAGRLEIPELEEWAEYAEQTFPDSIFTLVDVSYNVFMAAYNKKEWEKAIRYGERYRAGLRLLRRTPLPQAVESELALSVIDWGGLVAERTILTGLADAYHQNGQGEKALELFAEVPGEKLDPGQVRNAAILLTQLHAQTMLDALPMLTAFYDQISSETPNKQKQQARLAAFDAIAAGAFTKVYREEEKKHNGYHRPAYTAYRCLADKCEAGRAAAIMITDDPAEMREWLMQVEDWQALPIEALERALQAGIAFPLEEKPLNMETLDGLAAKLTHNDNPARQITLALAEDAEYPGLQSLFWAQSLALAALRSFDWTLGKNSAPVSKFACPEKKKGDAASEKPEDTLENGFALIRKFAQIESALLPLLYAPGMLAEENAALLPPMHRWGLTCVRAFEALDTGKPQEYLALLRKGLAACPGEKEVVQFLLDRFKEDTRPKASPELLALAERVRTILAAYDPNDPAVAALKANPAYQQVAWLIEPEPAGQPVQ